jgi:hypothetical protein
LMAMAKAMGLYAETVPERPGERRSLMECEARRREARRAIHADGPAMNLRSKPAPAGRCRIAWRQAEASLHGPTALQAPVKAPSRGRRDQQVHLPPDVLH